MSETYQRLLKRLLDVNLHSGIKLGLQNSLKLDASLGYPSQTFPSIHIAGTNGKGSVSTKIAAALQASGLRVGLYTSPHIACFRERIRINGEMISEKQVVNYLPHLFVLTEQQKIPATFFELTTLMAFAYFAKEKIDIAVIETGLGGRFDATNIIHPELSVITSISLEHTELLGSTLEAIAFEKAGIIKPFTPVVIGPHVPLEVIKEIAVQQSSPCIHIDQFFPDFHAENEAIAKRALQVLEVNSSAIDRGLTALPPCRLEIFQMDQSIVILDVGHNPNGFQHMLQAIQLRYPNRSLRFVLGLSKNKDLQGCLNVLKNSATHFHLVEAKNSRAAPKELLKEQLLELGVRHQAITCENDVAYAIHHAAKSRDIVVVCGTFFIMGSAREALGIREPQDFVDMNER